MSTLECSPRVDISTSRHIYISMSHESIMRHPYNVQQTDIEYWLSFAVIKFVHDVIIDQWPRAAVQHGISQRNVQVVANHCHQVARKAETNRQRRLIITWPITISEQFTVTLSSFSHRISTCGQDDAGFITSFYRLYVIRLLLAFWQLFIWPVLRKHRQKLTLKNSIQRRLPFNWSQTTCKCVCFVTFA